MEVALRRRLEGAADISISLSKQTAEVRFAPASRTFMPGSFRQAVGEAKVEVLRFEIDVCGVIERRQGALWLDAGDNSFRVTEPGAAATGRPVCVSGWLDDRGDLMDLAITTVESAGG